MAGVPGRVVLLRVVGLVGVLGLVGLGAASLVAGFFEVRSERTTAATGPVGAVDVDTATGDVEVRAGAPGTPVTVTTTRRWSFAEPTATVRETGGTLLLRGRCGDAPLQLLDRCDVTFTVTVPPGTRAVVRTATGDVRLAGRLGDVTVRTASGDVRFGGAGAGRAEVTTAAGDVDLEFAAPPAAVVARTAAGDVTVLVPPDGTAYRVTTQVAAGRATVQVPQDPAAARLLEVSASAGDVVVAARPAAAGTP